MQLAKRFTDNIFYYTNVIEDPQRIIDTVEKLDTYPGSYVVAPKWENWGTSTEDGFYFGKKKDFNLEKINEVQEFLGTDVLYVTNTITAAIDQVASAFYKDSKIDNELKYSKNARISKYLTGASMGPHYDQMDGNETIEYSIIIYYNDNYDGGEISFTIIDKEIETFRESIPKTFSIKPEAGSALIFPSSKPYYHEVGLIKGGERYISPGFIFKKDKK